MAQRNVFKKIQGSSLTIEAVRGKGTGTEGGEENRRNLYVSEVLKGQASKGWVHRCIRTPNIVLSVRRYLSSEGTSNLSSAIFGFDSLRLPWRIQGYKVKVVEEQDTIDSVFETVKQL